ncbi:hypothetical protein ACPCK2_17960 [Streptomyces pseudogriseolus]|uniref:hypothetical protein n=2 Tax=Streptomyces pseudogriseolus TaxID=36817 RepID=UPI003FA29DB7
MTLTVLTHGRYLDVRPWIVVVYVAAAVARGKERVRQLARRLRVWVSWAGQAYVRVMARGLGEDLRCRHDPPIG